MAAHSKQDIDFSETANWNVAKDYSTTCIMRPLFLADEYERIAKFGTTDMMTSFSMTQSEKNAARLTALEWLIDTLMTLINNTHFAVRVKDKPLLRGYMERLEKIYPFVPRLRIDIKSNSGKKGVKIRDEYFDRILSEVIKIKREIKDPLNRADLIFSSIEEFDPTKLKEAWKEKLSTTG